MRIIDFYEWLDAREQENKTPEEIARLFIESSPNFPNKQGKMLLHYTADIIFHNEFRLALIRQLFINNIDANVTDQQGRSALHDFAAAPHMQNYYFFDHPFPEIAKLFFENNAKFTIQDNNGETPLDLLLQHPDPDSLVMEVLIKLMLLEKRYLIKPISIINNELVSDYWNTCKNNIDKLQKYKIPNSNCTLYDICTARNPTKLATLIYPDYEEIKRFKPEDVKDSFYGYTDRLLTNLKAIAQEYVQLELRKIENTNAALSDTCKFIHLKCNVAVKEDNVRAIFHYLSPKQRQIMHVAANPHALFRYNKPYLPKNTEQVKPSNISSRETQSDTQSCCCVI